MLITFTATSRAYARGGVWERRLNFGFSLLLTMGGLFVLLLCLRHFCTCQGQEQSNTRAMIGVVIGEDELINKVTLQCLGGDGNFIRPATFFFFDPTTGLEERERRVTTSEGQPYLTFTIRPDNEGEMACGSPNDGEVSERALVTGMWLDSNTMFVFLLSSEFLGWGC